jgi:Family of unknown function (DUF6314)
MMAFPVADLNRFLLGSWNMSRRMRDFRLGISGWFEGHANVCVQSGDLILQETGRLRFGAHEADAGQRYVLTLDQPHVARVKRADGSLFHELDLSSGSANILHRCGDDIYRGRYRVLHGDCFFVVWQVTGPRKDYRMVTRLMRVAPLLSPQE